MSDAPQSQLRAAPQLLHRLRIMLLLDAQDELCICELICALNDSQPKISRHLAQLRACGLLEDRRQGQWIYYRLHPQLPTWVREVLTITFTANQSWMQKVCRAWIRWATVQCA